MIGTIVILVARVISAAAFLVALVMKFAGMGQTAAAIASIGFPYFAARRSFNCLA
jgi:uncharacterized membrane protein YphA (DoxX/SURF4 family)